MGSELIVILLVAGIAYWLYSTGQLNKIIGTFTNQTQAQVEAQPEETQMQAQEQAQDVVQENVGSPGSNVRKQSTSVETENGETDVDISGDNAGAIVNGKCHGDPVQCAKAQRLLDQIS